MPERVIDSEEKLFQGERSVTLPASLPRLLVVDDQPINIQILFEVFNHDHEIFVATNGRQAIQMAQKSMPDLILLDVVMPDVGGLEVCRLLKLDPVTRDIPIIFVTAQETPEDETKGLEAGAVDFISKPINTAVVRARVRTQLTLKSQADQLRSMVFIDGLTGVANRRRFDESLQAEWGRCRRDSVPLTVFMVDVDHFKKYNDMYGHQAGDDCLQTIAAILNLQLGRSYDLVARYGGEEFVCLLPGIDRAGALQKGEQIVRAIFDRGLPHAASDTAPVVTISLGAAFTVPGPDRQPEELVSAADAQLYRAKRNGRNQLFSRELT